MKKKKRITLIIMSVTLLSTFCNKTISAQDHQDHDEATTILSLKERFKPGADHDGHDHGETESGHDGHDHGETESGHDHGETGSGHDGHDNGETESGHDGHDHGEAESDHDEHSGGKAIGPGKAIEEIDPMKGFRLSIEAVKTLEIELETYKKAEFAISKSSLVTSKSEKGIYRLRDGFFKLIPVELIGKTQNGYVVKVSELAPGDQIVSNGAGLLRVADVYSTDSAEYSHSH